jgi:hypothetical protein
MVYDKFRIAKFVWCFSNVTKWVIALSSFRLKFEKLSSSKDSKFESIKDEIRRRTSMALIVSESKQRC